MQFGLISSVDRWMSCFNCCNKIIGFKNVNLNTIYSDDVSAKVDSCIFMNAFYE